MWEKTSCRKGQAQKTTHCNTSQRLCSRGSGRYPPLEVDMEIEDIPITMELDTGAAYTLVSEVTFQTLWPGQELQPSQVRLSAYTGDNISVVGSREVRVQYRSQVFTLPLLIVKGEGPSLLGRNWL